MVKIVVNFNPFFSQILFGHKFKPHMLYSSGISVSIDLSKFFPLVCLSRSGRLLDIVQ